MKLKLTADLICANCDAVDSVEMRESIRSKGWRPCLTYRLGETSVNFRVYLCPTCTAQATRETVERVAAEFALKTPLATHIRAIFRW